MSNKKKNNEKANNKLWVKVRVRTRKSEFI